VYKICRAAEWHALKNDGRWSGSADDSRDGFIHLSTAEQVRGTLERHFRGEANLVLLRVEASALGEALRFEPSRGGALFPHLYGELTLDAVEPISFEALSSEP
jgi:uncharacterized protein (DUF952 family)